MNATTDQKSLTPEEARRKLQASIDRANTRAIEMAEAGVRPVLNRSEMAHDGLSTLQRWTVPSRTTAGTLYNVTLVADATGLNTTCSCQAGESGKPCWHRGLVRRAALHEAPFVDSRRPALVVSLSDLHGRPTAGLVLTDEAGNGTAPDPWPADLDDAAAFAAVS